MEIVQICLLVLCAVLIALVLMQSSKSGDMGNIMTGGSSDLFKNRKERGSELFLSRMTLFLGILFFVICLVLSLM